MWKICPSTEHDYQGMQLLVTKHGRPGSLNRVCSNDAPDDCMCLENSNSDVAQCICKRVLPINKILQPQHLQEFGGMCAKCNLQLTENHHVPPSPSPDTDGSKSHTDNDLVEHRIFACWLEGLKIKYLD